jgi:glutamate--cysteine ligase
MIRNFRRLGWLVLYLFGASPAICRSFGSGRDLGMSVLNDGTWYAPFGTSLRMSDLGYSNRNQARIHISLNDLDEYIRDLSAAISTPEPAFERIGVKVDGEYRQLNANRLQIENEYYSPIRPKRVAHSGERPTMALRRGGIEYVEIRSLDINIDDPAGINQNTMRFMEAFLIYCLLEESPGMGDADLDEAQANQVATAKHGRDPGFRLLRKGAETGLKNWSSEVLDNVLAVAEVIDRQENDGSYAQAVRLMQALVAEPESTPSARMLAELQRENCSFFELALALSENHRDYFANIAPLLDDRGAELELEAKSSLERQREIEANDRQSFDEYLEHYFTGD